MTTGNQTEKEIIRNWNGSIQDPIVSISCCTYNHEKYIAQTIDSFLRQKTFFPFEILIHDDASTDKTTEIIKKYEKNYPNLIKPIYQTTNQYSKGLYASQINVKRAKGKYIALCEGDDYWNDSHKLQTQIEWLESHPNYSMCCSDAIIETPDGILDWHRYEKDCDIPVKDMIIGGGGFVETATLTFRKELLNHYPKTCKDCYVADYPLKIWCVLNGKVRYFSKKMSVYRFLQPGSWSSKRQEMPLEELKKYYLSEFLMFSDLNSLSSGRYNHIFIDREARLLYNLLRERKRDKKNILNAFKKYEQNFKWNHKIEGLLIRLNLWSCANSYLALTEKKYLDALCSLPFFKQLIFFLYHRKIQFKSIFFPQKICKCPFCGKISDKMKPIGIDNPTIKKYHIIGAGKRLAGCPYCGATDRERLVYTYLKHELNIYSKPQTKILHIAPEMIIANQFVKHLFTNYACGDFYAEGQHAEYSKEFVKYMDVQNLPFANNSFDLIICNHVLEHVSDEKKAMQELYRVLEKNGIAILQVPFSPVLETTISDPTIIDKDILEKRFGQKDHVRLFGKDYKAKLESCGFRVQEIKLQRKYPKYGLNPKEILFVGRK